MRSEIPIYLGAEGPAFTDAVPVQVGSQYMSMGGAQKAAELIKSGRLGQVHLVEGQGERVAPREQLEPRGPSALGLDDAGRRGVHASRQGAAREPRRLARRAKHDAEESVKSFVERRPPHYTGR